jgi:hypothetical protein
MTDDDDLPDHDYASIYGAELLHARQHARQRHLLQRLDMVMAHQDALITFAGVSAGAARPSAPQNASARSGVPE